MAIEFTCRVCQKGECSFWLRECVGFENCSLAGEVPCAICMFSSPLRHEKCKDCSLFEIKRQNYSE